MKRYVAWFALAGAVIPVLAFGLSLIYPLFPSPILHLIEILCPGYIMFMATADCEPFDACSLQTLAMVTASNVVLYGVLGSVIWFVRHGAQRLNPR
jgi:hypothetical protein